MLLPSLVETRKTYFINLHILITYWWNLNVHITASRSMELSLMSTVYYALRIVSLLLEKQTCHESLNFLFKHQERPWFERHSPRGHFFMCFPLWTQTNRFLLVTSSGINAPMSQKHLSS